MHAYLPALQILRTIVDAQNQDLNKDSSLFLVEIALQLDNLY